MKKLQFVFMLCVSCLLFTRCSSSSETQKTAYEMMEVAFEGNPQKTEIQPLLESVMKKCDLEINEENLQRAASGLVALRRDSKKGVTEMQILKQMSKEDKAGISFPDLAGLSAAVLELE